ncbi:MAG: site-specific DNA-methyltransferase, partial [Streptococcaceae bacterium]|nr:site-specific DNA-methyltransferase [Streptococcaceae bacterium]
IVGGDTLQRLSARDDRDEKHISPLQLSVIERCIKLWTNEGDIVFSPFGGIGSEPYQANKMKRRAVAIELKPSYYKQMVNNLKQLEDEPEQIDLFEGLF